MFGTSSLQVTFQVCKPSASVCVEKLVDVALGAEMDSTNEASTARLQLICESRLSVAVNEKSTFGSPVAELSAGASRTMDGGVRSIIRFRISLTPVLPARSVHEIFHR